MRHPYEEEIKKTLKKLKENSRKEEEVYSLLFELKKYVFIIDIFELERLIRKSNESRKKIEGKDVTLVIGQTGSGKTTTILKFLGYQFK